MIILKSIIILSLFLSCDNDDNNDKNNTRLSMNLGTQSASKVSSKTADVTLSQVKILVDRVMFHSANKDSSSYKGGPYVVVLDTNLTTAQVSNSVVPEGTFNKVSFKIHKPSKNDVLDDAEFINGDDTFSMIIRGSYNGQDFILKIDKTIKQDVVFDENLVIGANSDFNTTLSMNTTSWFSSSKGGVLDPSDSNNVSEIEKNIKSSFRLFKDKNKDGIED